MIKVCRYTPNIIITKKQTKQIFRHHFYAINTPNTEKTDIRTRYRNL